MRLGHHYDVKDRGYATPCWMWQRYIDHNGYGRVSQGHRRMVAAHRAAWENAHGAIPVGLEVHHRCEQTACVNPAHMEIVTRAEHARLSRSAQKTHCVNGHVYDEANTYIRPSGRRDCRRCTADRQRTYQARKVAA